MARNAAVFLDNDSMDPDATKIYDYLFIPEGKSRVLSVLQNLNQFFSPNTDKANAADVVRQYIHHARAAGVDSIAGHML
ncbi:MAG: hypothetical protein Q9228_003511 [Teloschistes exilis]